MKWWLVTPRFTNKINNIHFYYTLLTCLQLRLPTNQNRFSHHMLTWIISILYKMYYGIENAMRYLVACWCSWISIIFIFSNYLILFPQIYSEYLLIEDFILEQSIVYDYTISNRMANSHSVVFHTMKWNDSFYMYITTNEWICEKKNK